MNRTKEEASLLRGEVLIGHVLRYGVLIAGFILFLGLVLSYLHEPHQSPSPIVVTNIRSIFALALSGDGKAIITLGLFLLIALPVLRVALVFFIFLYQRDYFFVLMSLIVLTVLLCGLFLGKGL